MARLLSWRILAKPIVGPHRRPGGIHFSYGAHVVSPKKRGTSVAVSRILPMRETMLISIQKEVAQSWAKSPCRQALPNP